MFGRSKWKTRAKELEIKLARTEEYVSEVLSFKAGRAAGQSIPAANPYRDRERLVSELVQKYKGYARSGNQLVQRLVDTRAAFAMANGLSAAPLPGEGPGPELEFLRRLIRENRLDGQFGQQLAVEKELEGQVLLTLDYEPAADSIKTRFISWNDSRYEVEYARDDYAEITAITYEDENGGEVSVPPERAVFIKFNARVHGREGAPTLSGLLQEAEDVDHALRDWRKINRFFASPTPYFKTRDVREAMDLYERLLAPGVDWKIGKVFVGPADFSLVGMSDSGYDSIQREIETKVKILAGGAGVPVQFLGFPEFMSNRATADNTMEPVALVSISEQRSWLGGFSELFDKAIELRNENALASAAPLKKGKVRPSMKFVTRAQIERLTELYLPLFQAGAIGLDTLLGLLPDVDPDKEKQEAASRGESGMEVFQPSKEEEGGEI